MWKLTQQISFNSFCPQIDDWALKSIENIFRENAFEKKKNGESRINKYIYIYNFFLIQYLSRDIQFSRASLNGALTQRKNEDMKTLKLDN